MLDSSTHVAQLHFRHVWRKIYFCSVGRFLGRASRNVLNLESRRALSFMTIGSKCSSKRAGKEEEENVT